MTSAQQHAQHRCSFCGYSIPEHVAPVDGPERAYCSEPCREAAADDEAPFADAVGFKRRTVGVPALESALPEGYPANAAVLLNAEEGAHREGVLLEWIWRTLAADRPALVLSIDSPPTALIDGFLAHGWNVLPYLARGDLLFLDAFTERLADEASYEERNNRWSDFLQSRFDDAVRRVRDPSDLRELSNQIDDGLEALDATNRGLVAIDSLTELASLTQDVQAANFLREIRAIVCKSRYVPIVAGGSVEGDDDLYASEFPRTHEFLFDGVVDLQVNSDLVEGRRIRRCSVRKMAGAPVDADWFAFEFVPGVGYARSDVVGLQEPAQAVSNGGGQFGGGQFGGQHDVGQPGTGQLGTSQSGAGQLGASQPGNGQLGAGQSDAGPGGP